MGEGEGVLDAGNQIQIPTTQNCDSTNDIYCIVCSKCKKLYVGETGLSFGKRINIHRSDVRLKKDAAVATHFNSGSCRATHLRVLYLEILKNTGGKTLNKIGRLEAERKWQLALKTYSPFKQTNKTWICVRFTNKYKLMAIAMLVVVPYISFTIQ